MHELVVVRSIVEAVTEHARGDTVTVVRLVIGSQSGVSPQALEFCFALATRETVLDGADLVMDVRSGRQLMIDSIEVV